MEKNFRIVEKFGKYRNTFHIEKKVIVNNTLFHRIFGFEPKVKWKQLRFERYAHYVNRVWHFESSSAYAYHSTMGAAKFIENYIEFLKAEPFRYNGKKFRPMFYYNHHDDSYSLRYYDTSSYKTYGEHDKGYRNIGTKEQLKYREDDKNAEGKLIKIYSYD